MNPNVRIEKSIMSPTQIEAAMITDHPVVPPDSIIKTFSHIKGEDVNLVLTQDGEGLSVGSFVIKNGEWAKFFLDTWYDPLYRSYNFQKAETHALVSAACPSDTELPSSVLTLITGAYCSVAPDYSLQTGPLPPEDHECVQQSAQGREVRGRRLSRPIPWMPFWQGCAELRN